MRLRAVEAGRHVPRAANRGFPDNAVIRAEGTKLCAVVAFVVGRAVRGAAPVTTARAARSGRSRLPRPVVGCGNPVVTGGAKPCAARAEAWLGGDPGPGAHLAVFDDLDPAVRRADIDAWRDGVARLSRSWAQPLLNALNLGAVSRVVIDDERGDRFTAPAGGLLQWWRRNGLAVRIAGTRGQVP